MLFLAKIQQDPKQNAVPALHLSLPSSSIRGGITERIPGQQQGPTHSSAAPPTLRLPSHLGGGKGRGFISYSGKLTPASDE